MCGDRARPRRAVRSRLLGRRPPVRAGRAARGPAGGGPD
ncbi:hypothetical protein ACFV00_08050, partial [Streptomyces californicus]